MRVRITASAPTRIDLAGGTIDIWPLYLFHHGAQTLNAAISIRAHVSLEPRQQWVVEGVAPHDPVGKRSAIARATADRYRVVTADRVVPIDVRMRRACAGCLDE